MQDDPEERIADLERRLAAAHVADPKRERRERRMRVRRDAGISRALWQVERVAAITLVLLSIVGFALLFVGGGAPTRIGPALFGGPAVTLVTLSWVHRRRVEKVRWQDGIVTFRTVEPGNVGESGQRVDCEVELSPLPFLTRIYTTIGPLDAELIVVGQSMRCLIDRMETLIALRAFPHPEPDARLPSGRELKFFRAFESVSAARQIHSWSKTSAGDQPTGSDG